jgi:hypothetical protein
MRTDLFEESDLLVAYLPAFGSNGSVIGFRVMGLANKNLEYWSYGPVPISFTDASSVTHEVGVIPTNFTTPAYELPNNLPGIPTTSSYTADIFYHENPAHLYDLFVNYNEVQLKNYLQLPLQIPIATVYQSSLTPPADLGYKVGEFRITAFPFLRVGIQTLNQTNRNLRTNLTIRLRELQVAVIRDGQLLYDMVTRQGDGKYAKYFNVGGARWSSDYKSFQSYGFGNTPIDVLELLNAGRTGAQAVVNKYLTNPSSKVPYINARR